MNDTSSMSDKSGTRTIDGRVSSAKSAKTITVVVDRQEQHGLYGKLLRLSTKLNANDEKG
jgi:small subunit ribosomal protein S17